jgi:hypothetical protein
LLSALASVADADFSVEGSAELEAGAVGAEAVVGGSGGSAGSGRDGDGGANSTRDERAAMRSDEGNSESGGGVETIDGVLEPLAV